MERDARQTDVLVAGADVRVNPAKPDFVDMACADRLGISRPYSALLQEFVLIYPREFLRCRSQLLRACAPRARHCLSFKNWPYRLFRPRILPARVFFLPFTKLGPIAENLA